MNNLRLIQRRALKALFIKNNPQMWAKLPPEVQAQTNEFLETTLPMVLQEWQDMILKRAISGEGTKKGR